MVSIGRFLSWLPNVRPVLARRMILDGALTKTCSADLYAIHGVMGNIYPVVGPIAATAIIAAYKAGQLPLYDGAKVGSTRRAEVYACSPLRVGAFRAKFDDV